MHCRMFKCRKEVEFWLEIENIAAPYVTQCKVILMPIVDAEHSCDLSLYGENDLELDELFDQKIWFQGLIIYLNQNLGVSLNMGKAKPRGYLIRTNIFDCIKAYVTNCEAIDRIMKFIKLPC